VTPLKFLYGAKDSSLLVTNTREAAFLTMTTITYKPWSSDIELSFYATLGNLKIDKDRLDDSARKVLGLYELRPGDTPERSARMQILHNSLTSDEYAHV
jgi:hypothetical protein